ncbi:MAG: hypothetical protein MZU97_07965 [Bacillus subtilis]|nr:hypothetical protein [Bacillus subtilis]
MPRAVRGFPSPSWASKTTAGDPRQGLPGLLAEGVPPLRPLRCSPTFPWSERRNLDKLLAEREFSLSAAADPRQAIRAGRAAGRDPPGARGVHRGGRRTLPDRAPGGYGLRHGRNLPGPGALRARGAPHSGEDRRPASGPAGNRRSRTRPTTGPYCP